MNSKNSSMKTNGELNKSNLVFSYQNWMWNWKQANQSAMLEKFDYLRLIRKTPETRHDMRRIALTSVEELELGVWVR